MASMKIRVYKNNSPDPEHTITVPIGIIRIAEKIIPRKLKATLEAKGIDIGAIAGAVSSEDIRGLIAEIEEHKKNERIVISIE